MAHGHCKYPQSDEDERKLFNQIKDLGAEGKSITQIAAEIGIARSTLYLWMEEYPALSDAVKRANELAQAWWENVGQSQAVSGTGNGNQLYFPDEEPFP